jgi:hypothetical protein
VPARGPAVAALLAVSVLTLHGALLAGCGSAGGSAAGAAPAFSGATLDGKTVTLAVYRGKPLLLVYMTST